MTLRHKRNHEIIFSAPNIRYVDAGIMKWYKIEQKEEGVPSALSAYYWEPIPENP